MIYYYTSQDKSSQVSLWTRVYYEWKWGKGTVEATFFLFGIFQEKILNVHFLPTVKFIYIPIDSDAIFIPMR